MTERLQNKFLHTEVYYADEDGNIESLSPKTAELTFPIQALVFTSLSKKKKNVGKGEIARNEQLFGETFHHFHQI